jgi:hypothetical protein
MGDIGWPIQGILGLHCFSTVGLIVSNRTLDREAADTLRHLAGAISRRPTATRKASSRRGLVADPGPGLIAAVRSIGAGAIQLFR